MSKVQYVSLWQWGCVLSKMGHQGLVSITIWGVGILFFKNCSRRVGINTNIGVVVSICSDCSKRKLVRGGLVH